MKLDKDKIIKVQLIIANWAFFVYNRRKGLRKNVPNGPGPNGPKKEKTEVICKD